MKKIIFITLCGLLSLYSIQAKKIPDWVHNRLDSIKKEIQKSLTYYRLWDVEINGYRTLSTGLGFYTPFNIFSYEETNLIDSLGLNISIGMVYDNDMRNRIVQLLRNEYQGWELDSLVNLQIEYSAINIEREARKNCRFDTLRIFKAALDSFYTDLKNKNPEDSILIKYEYAEKYQYEHEIFKMLKLDTTTIFKQAYNKIVERKREREREELLNSTDYNHNYIYLAELCGYIGDKRFIQPIISISDSLQKREKELEILLGDKRFSYDGTDGKTWELIREYKEINGSYIPLFVPLVRMRVEPYYSDYVKKRTLTMEQIQDATRLNFRINDFVDVLGTQEAFLELSKYLLSDKPYSFEEVDYVDHSETTSSPVSYDAFYLIRENIENKEVQDMIGKGFIKDFSHLLKPLYDWMQKNYGKYKIKRIW